MHLWRPPKIRCLTPPPLLTCAHVNWDPPSPLWTPTCVRHEIHIALLKLQRPSGPKAEIRLYDCNLFKTVLLVIFITTLYRRKFPLFILSKDEILVK